MQPANPNETPHPPASGTDPGTTPAPRLDSGLEPAPSSQSGLAPAPLSGATGSSSASAKADTCRERPPAAQGAGTAVGGNGPSHTLPEFLPHTPPATVRPIWIPWPLAVLLAPLFWVMPRRFGPHFAAASWTAAIVAHLAWGVYGAACIFLAIASPQYTLIAWLLGRTPEQQGLSLAPIPTLGEILRGPLVLLATDPTLLLMMAPPTTTAAAPQPMVLVPVELGLCAAAALLMPFVAAGEPSRWVLGRSLKLVLWSSTSLIVLAIAIQAMLVRDKNMIDHWPVALLVALYCAWAVRLVIRGGSRYAGLAEGPAWEQREPLCAGCGYGLTGLPYGGHCPECGQVIARSLPEYRQCSAFAAANSLLARMRAFPRTWWQALRGKEFYERLATRDGLPAARRFAAWTCAVSAVLLPAAHILAFELGNRLAGRNPGAYWDELPWICIVAIWLNLSLIGLVGLAALAGSRFGWRPIHNRAIAAFYWSTWLLPLGVSVIMPIVSTVWLGDNQFLRSHSMQIPQVGPVDLYVAVTLSVLVIPLCVLWRAIAHLAGAVRGIRHANT